MTESIFNIRSKKDRDDSEHNSNWVESKTTMCLNSDKAQTMHRSIFEMMILELELFSMVNRPAISCHHALLIIYFEVASE